MMVVLVMAGGNNDGWKKCGGTIIKMSTANWVAVMIMIEVAVVTCRQR